MAGNGHSEWGLMQPARVKGQGFIVQELPLPLVSSPSAGEPVSLVVSLCFSFQTPARALQILWQAAWHNRTLHHTSMFSRGASARYTSSHPARGWGHQAKAMPHQGLASVWTAAVPALRHPRNDVVAAAAVWLKVKVQTPSSSCFVHADRSTRDGPVRYCTPSHRVCP